jgi:hypothetical protein
MCLQRGAGRATKIRSSGCRPCRSNTNSEHGNRGFTWITLTQWRLQGKLRQPQLQPRSSGSGQQGVPAAAATNGKSTSGAPAPRSPPCKSPSLDSARHNSGHLTTGGLLTSHDAGNPAKPPAVATASLQAPEQQGDQRAVVPNALDALASGQQLDADGSHSASGIAAVLANVLNMVRTLQVTEHCTTRLPYCALLFAYS